jgi:hypothetical protein
VHEADPADKRFDAPAATGLDILIRGLTLTSDADEATLTATNQLLDRRYECLRQHLLTGRPPSWGRESVAIPDSHPAQGDHGLVQA